MQSPRRIPVTRGSSAGQSIVNDDDVVIEVLSSSDEDEQGYRIIRKEESPSSSPVQPSVSSSPRRFVRSSTKNNPRKLRTRKSERDSPLKNLRQSPRRRATNSSSSVDDIHAGQKTSKRRWGVLESSEYDEKLVESRSNRPITAARSVMPPAEPSARPVGKPPKKLSEKSGEEKPPVKLPAIPRAKSPEDSPELSHVKPATTSGLVKKGKAPSIPSESPSSGESEERFTVAGLPSRAYFQAESPGLPTTRTLRSSTGSLPLNTSPERDADSVAGRTRSSSGSSNSYESSDSEGELEILREVHLQSPRQNKARNTTRYHRESERAGRPISTVTLKRKRGSGTRFTAVKHRRTTARLSTHGDDDDDDDDSDAQTTQRSMRNLRGRFPDSHSPQVIRSAPSKPAISCRTRNSTSMILMRDNKPIPVFIQFKVPKRTQFASDVKSMTGEDLLLYPTAESLNLTHRDLVEELRGTIRLNTFKFYDSSLLDDSRQVGYLLDLEPYLVYDPDTDKVLPKPRDVYDGGAIEGDVSLEINSQDQPQTSVATLPQPSQPLRPLTSTQQQPTQASTWPQAQFPSERIFTTSSANKFDSSSSRYSSSMLRTSGMAPRHRGSEVPFELDDDDEEDSDGDKDDGDDEDDGGEDDEDDNDGETTQPNQTDEGNLGVLEQSLFPEQSQNDDDDGFDAVEESASTVNAAQTSVQAPITAPTLIPVPPAPVSMEVVKIPVVAPPINFGGVGDSYSPREDITIIDALRGPHVADINGMRDLAIQVLSETVFNNRRTFSSILTRWKQLSKSLNSVRNMAQVRGITPLDLEPFFQGLDRAKEMRKERNSAATIDQRQANHRSNNFTIEEDLEFMKFALVESPKFSTRKKSFVHYASTHTWRSVESWKTRYQKEHRPIIQLYKTDPNDPRVRLYKALLDEHKREVELLDTTGAAFRSRQSPPPPPSGRYLKAFPNFPSTNSNDDHDDVDDMLRDDNAIHAAANRQISTEGSTALRDDNDDVSNDEEAYSSGNEVNSQYSMEFDLGDGDDYDKTVFPFSRGVHRVPVTSVSQSEFSDVDSNLVQSSGSIVV